MDNIFVLNMCHLRTDSISRCPLISIGIPIIKKRWSHDSLLLAVGISVLVRWCLYIESNPGCYPNLVSSYFLHVCVCVCLKVTTALCCIFWGHDDVIKWKHFPRYWPFVRGIHRSRWIPHIKASDLELWCFLNKRLSKQSWGWWF